ncbi:MAG TPA: membrane protein insertase YidC [Nitrospiria bacterium]|nr:membrane protein insertase YidC [Nitrospiria bacterium]
MEKRFILFLVLSFTIMMAYPYVVEKLGLVPSSPGLGQPEKAAEKQDFAQPPSGVVGAKPLAIPVSPREEQTIQINTPLYHAGFSSRGGKLVVFELKKYTGLDRKTPIKLYQEGAGAPPAFSIQTPDAGLNERMDRGLYTVDGHDLTLDEQNKTGTVAFRFQDPDTGIRVSKRVSFWSDSYRIGLDIETEGVPDRYLFSIGRNFGITDWGQKRGFVGFVGPVTDIGGELVKDNPAKMEKEVRHEGPIAWTALQDKYFIAAAITTGAGAAVVSRLSPVSVNTELEFKSAGAGPAINHLLLYTGPKEHQRLKALGVGLEETVDFGWFIYGSWAIVRWIARPLFYILQFLHGFTGNYGVSIVLLTVGVRVLFIPLTHKSYRSMRAMQALQPQLQALQKKYKEDRQRLQREMMELYQKNKVNPVGGCLPMILQIPVFVALFNVLYTTIELRQAPFILWIHDLADKDPYFVLPIIMGFTMLIQQKMQPTTMDPTQAKIFLMMPVLMTFLFLNFPTGLVLYMITNNVLTVSQQYFTMKYFETKHEKESGKKEPGKTPAAGPEKS